MFKRNIIKENMPSTWQHKTAKKYLILGPELKIYLKNNRIGTSVKVKSILKWLENLKNLQLKATKQRRQNYF